MSELDPVVRRIIPAYFILFLWNVAWAASITGPVLPLYVESLGVGIIGWSALAAAFAVGMFLLEWVWGSLSDKADQRLLMVLSVLSMSVLFILYTNHALIQYFIILQLFSGAVGIIIGPITRAYVSDNSPEKSIGLFSSLWWTFHTLGRIVGPILGTFVAQTWSFETSFYTSSAVSIILAGIIILSFPNRKRRRFEESPNIVRGLKLLFKMHSARLLFLAALFSFMGVAVVRSYLPLYASEQIGMSIVEIGILTSSVWGAQLIAMPFLGWISDRYGRTRSAFLGFIITAIPFLLYLVARTQAQFFAVSVFIGLGLSVSTLLLAMVPSIAPSTMYGSVVGVYGSFEDLGVIIAPMVFGFIWSTYGAVFIFAATAVTQIITGLLVLAIHRDRPQK